MTGLLLDGMYHMSHIKKGSACTPLGIVDKFDTYETALKNTLYQHKGMLLQNLHHRYLYIVIKLPHLSDLEQRIPSFLNCDNYGLLTASNPDPLLDDTPTNDNELHQVICNTFKIDYFQEMDTIIKLLNRLECKINHTLLALLPNKLNIMKQGYLVRV